ncbi:MAG: hemolysin III family protein [Pseudomonadota bacterium]
MARHTAHISPSAGRPYDRAELLSDAVIHLMGLGLAVFSVPVLITLTAVWRGDAAGIVGVSIYGVTLIVMLSASLAYNHVYREDLSDTLRKLDMSAIYLKIAGTVTPFALLSGTGAIFLAAMWTVAVLATATVFLRKRRSSGLSVGIGLGMGWAVLFGGGEVIASTSWPVFGLMIAGGVLYSLGTPFLLLHRLRFHNAIWHAFVVLASGVFFVAITWHLISTAMI